MKNHQLHKIDAAKRQLITAIRLFFSNDDSVSVFTLAGNAWEIIDTLCQQNSIGSLSDETESRLPDGVTLRCYINPIRNFLKHADRDPDGVLTGFSDESNDSVLILAVEDYIRFRKKSPIEFQVYQIWYFAIYPEKLSERYSINHKPDFEQLFPDILKCSRKEQKTMGQEAMQNAKRDRELINHRDTESGDI